MGALAGFFLLAPPLSWVAVSACAVFAAGRFLATSVTAGRSSARRPVLVDGGFRAWMAHHGTHGFWQDPMRDQCHHVSGFSKCAVLGGVCLDQKGLYWEILVKMAAHFGREKDLTLLQTRPLGRDELWRPVHTINITGNPNVPASTYAKVIVDTAASLTGGRGQNPFFPTKAQIAIQTGFEVLRHMEAYVKFQTSIGFCSTRRMRTRPSKR